MHYDPMIAKLLEWGEDRNIALTKMKDCLSKFQVAGLPTNTDSLLKLANHGAFENGEVETHFIELHTDDLSIDSNNSLSTQKARNAAVHSAAIAAVCVCEKEHSAAKESVPGNLSVWHANPPIRVNHCVKRFLELEWDDESSNTGLKIVPVHVSFLLTGKYLIETGLSDFSGIEMNVLRSSDHDFRVELDGVSTNVSIAVYPKDQMEHIHIWPGSHHHHFKCRKGIELADDVENHCRLAAETSSHPSGTMVAPMAGLVVKVLVKDGAKIDGERPILVLETMKMEHVVKASAAGYISGLRV